MVQQRPMQQGDLPFQRDTGWIRNDRPPYLDTAQENRFVNPTSSIHQRPLTVEAALRECAGIPVRDFSLVVTLENGEEKTFSSVSLAPYRQRIFTGDFYVNYRRAVRKANPDGAYSSSGYGPDSMYGEIDMNNEQGRKSSGSSESHRYRKNRSDDSDEDASSSSRSKKRARYPHSRGWREHSNDDTPILVPVQKTQQLRIGDSAEVEKFYACRFKDMQQSSCKVMGKAFVKLVEPKKQTHHPYTKGDGKAPPWWPPTTGDDNVKVRHKEPDHLLKPERIRLLVHILRMIVEPPKNQCATVLKLGLNVKKLEEVTMEAMSNWFNDKEHPENLQKKPYLKEIFKIAKAEERYKNGEIDGTTVIPVMYGERSGDGDGSDDESEEPTFKPEEDELEMPPNTTSSLSSLSTPDSMVSPLTGGHNRHLQSEPDSSSLGMRLPLRSMDDHFDQSSFFSRGLGVSFQQPRSPNAQESARGHGQFVSPQTSFHNPQMFWPPNMVSNAASTNYYVTSPQTTVPPSSSPFTPLPLLPNPQQSMLPPPPISTQHSFDGLPMGRTYDSSPALGQLRTGSIGHPNHVPQHPSFQDYLQDNSSFAHQESDLKEQQHHIHPS